MMYPIRIIKLQNGEVLIGGISETNDNASVYTFERPMSISLLPAMNKSKKQENMVFIKNWIDFSKDRMYIVPKSKVMCISTPDNEILHDYTEAKMNFDLLEADKESPNGQEDFDNSDDQDEGEMDNGDEEENPL
jgi:hypothetical protein